MWHKHLEPAIEPTLAIALGWFELSWLAKVPVDVLIDLMRLAVGLEIERLRTIFECLVVADEPSM